MWRRARLGVEVAQLRLKVSQLKLLPVWAYFACSANEYKF